MSGPSCKGYYSVYLFDLDGTLVDSAPDLVAAANHVLCKFGQPPVLEKQLTKWVGKGAKVLLNHAFASVAGERFATGCPTGCLEEFMSYYEHNIATFSKPYPTVTDTLVLLAEQGATLGVVTNKYKHLAEPLLQALDLSKYFSVVVGGKCAGQPKPAAAPIIFACNAMGIESDSVLMVGDTCIDQMAAIAAGVDYVEVDYGYILANTEGDSHLPAPKYISSFSELIPVSR